MRGDREMLTAIAFLIFSAALFGAAYYVWVLPKQAENDVLVGRLRELRARSGMRSRSTPDLIKRETRGSLAAMGDFVEWLGVLRRLQEYIDQANLKYRASEVFSLALLLFAGSYLVL